MHKPRNIPTGPAAQAPAQLELPLDAAPACVKAHGLRAAHPRPLASAGKDLSGNVIAFRTTPRKAWRYASLEYARAGSTIAALALDCDDPEAWRTGLADLPPPNWIVRRAANDHAHVVWTLETPVHRHSKARPEPLRWLAHIAEYYTATLGADPRYAGVLSHNPAPIFRQANGLETQWGAKLPYSLDGLASVIPFNWQPPRQPESAIGRNCAVFEAGMEWAAREANAALPVLPALLIVNQRFAVPLPHGEIASTAKSIERYRAQWAGRGWHCPLWIERQRQRGRKGGKASGEARRKAVAGRDGQMAVMRLRGASWPAIAEAFGVSRNGARKAVARFFATD